MEPRLTWTRIRLVSQSQRYAVEFLGCRLCQVFCGKKYGWLDWRVGSAANTVLRHNERYYSVLLGSRRRYPFIKPPPWKRCCQYKSQGDTTALTDMNPYYDRKLCISESVSRAIDLTWRRMRQPFVIWFYMDIYIQEQAVFALGSAESGLRTRVTEWSRVLDPWSRLDNRNRCFEPQRADWRLGVGDPQPGIDTIRDCLSSEGARGQTNF